MSILCSQTNGAIGEDNDSGLSEGCSYDDGAGPPIVVAQDGKCPMC